MHPKEKKEKIIAADQQHNISCTQKKKGRNISSKSTFNMPCTQKENRSNMSEKLLKIHEGKEIREQHQRSSAIHGGATTGLDAVCGVAATG